MKLLVLKACVMLVAVVHEQNGLRDQAWTRGAAQTIKDGVLQTGEQQEIERHAIAL